MNLEQLADFVRSELALKQHSDKQIAAGVKQVKLTEKLTDKTIIDLQAQGAGPKTVEALKYLKEQTATLKAGQDATSSPATAKAQEAITGEQAAVKFVPPPPPSEAKQKEILGAIREYVQNYLTKLPNFFCVEVTRRFADPNGGENFRSYGTILAKVGFNNGVDRYNVYSVNGKLVETTFDDDSVGGATSTGEFYSRLRAVFDSESQAQFAWDHWAKLRDRRMAVFSYSIDNAYSNYYISEGPKASRREIRVGYRGLIYGDPFSGEVTRITFEAVGIPSSFPIRAQRETLDYDRAMIAGTPYVLPLAAKLFFKTQRETTKNEIEFRAYRKFETDSFIKYDLDPNAPPPLPESKTEEKPVTTEPTKTAPTATEEPAQAPAKKKKSPYELPTLDDVPPPPPR